ncbi:MAG: hypothetical protein ACREIF_11705 [Chthoniobacterales bacterium]
MGAFVCLLAIFLSSGGHWVALQSIAYTRMLVQFAEKDPLGTAVKKAFDGQHSCSLCPKIREGFNQQHKAPRTMTGERLPVFLGQSSGDLFFALTRGLDISVVRSGYINFSTIPPKPPPRVVWFSKNQPPSACRELLVIVS